MRDRMFCQKIYSAAEFTGYINTKSEKYVAYLFGIGIYNSEILDPQI